MPSAASWADPYEVLGVQRDANTAEVRKAYQALALQLHPDKRASADAGEPAGTGDAVTFQQLQDAWETLRDEGSRAAYVSPHCPGSGGRRHLWGLLCTVCARVRVQDESYRLGEQAAEAHLAEVDLDDMEYDESQACFIWPCRCSSRFIVRESQLEEQLDTFECDTCALKIRVLYEFVDGDEEDEGEGEAGERDDRGKREGEAAKPGLESAA